MSVPTFRLAELIASLSMGIDLAIGQPMEHALRAAVLGVWLGEAVGLGPGDLSDVYYTALLRYLGCTAQLSELSELFGDEKTALAGMATVDPARPAELLAYLVRYVGAGHPFLRRTQMLGHALTRVNRVLENGIAGTCEGAQLLASRMGLGMGVRTALGQLFERWDGRGRPGRLRGEATTMATRVVQVAWDTELFYRLGGSEFATATLRHRAGGAYDPVVAACMCDRAPQLLNELPDGQAWEVLLAVEPGPQPCLSEAAFESALHAIADFVDLRSPFTYGHSTRVAELAEAAARLQGLPSSDVVAVRRAGYVHDLGRIAIPAPSGRRPGRLHPVSGSG